MNPTFLLNVQGVVYKDGLLYRIPTNGGAPVELTIAGGGSSYKTDYTYNVLGVKNNVNMVFNTTSNFTAGTTKVYLNGVRLTPGVGYDYQETGVNQITFAFAPHPTDQITIDYQLP